MYLVVALITLWLIGMNTLAEGYLTIEIVRDPFASVVSPLGRKGIEDVVKAAFFEALARHAKSSLPIGVAQLLLGGLLVFVSMRALFGRRASTSFAVQLVLANAALLVAGYVLREPIRGAIVNAVVASGLEQQPTGVSARDFDELVRSRWWWRFRKSLAIQLVALLLSGFALTRKSARELLAPVAPSPSDEF